MIINPDIVSSLKAGTHHFVQVEPFFHCIFCGCFRLRIEDHGRPASNQCEVVLGRRLRQYVGRIEWADINLDYKESTSG